MWKRLETYISEVVRSSKRGVVPFALKGVLRLSSWGYGLCANFYHWAYERGWRRRYFPPISTVISIGNIVAGGTGKTPLTLKLARSLSQNHPVAILTRGYRSPAENLSQPIALSQGKGPVYPSSYCGDEPYLLAENLPDTAVYVGRNRRLASQMAVKGGARCIVLDDGMQYRGLARDFDVVVVNGQDPLGLGYYLPRGWLRESAKGLRRAHLVIVNHIYDRAQFLNVKHLLARYTTAPIVAAKPVVTGVYNLHSEPQASFRGQRVGMFCGIAHPPSFRMLLEQEGIEVVCELVVPDHLSPKVEHLRNFAETCLEKGATALICTEKDRVKLNTLSLTALPITWVQMDLEFTENQEHWDTFLQTVDRRLSKSFTSEGGIS